MNARFKFSDSIKFIKTFKTSGTITPSSNTLINSLLSPINFDAPQCLVELGPGNGCITRAILDRMNSESVLICLEVNSDFASQLSDHNDPRLRVYNACASSMKDILDELGIESVDHVVSSLPLALINDAMVKNILTSVNENLRHGGRFLQYQYTLKNYSDVKPIFRDVKLKFTLRNMPPAFVYECIK